MSVFQHIVKEARRLQAHTAGSHDWSHTERVLKTALYLGKKEKADQEIIRYAAILHDIARPLEDASRGRICHAKKGAQLAEKILKKYRFPEEKINAVVHCIETHRYRGKLRPLSREAKVLFDADKLDSIGAVGLARSFLFAGEVGAKVHDRHVDVSRTRPYTREDTAYREYLVKLQYVKNSMLTSEGRKIARSRHEYMKQFFKRLNEEIEGKR